MSREEFLDPLSMSRNQLSRKASLPLSAVSAIAAEKRSVTAETALHLARYFETLAEFWLNLQTTQNLSCAQRKSGDAVNQTGRALNKAG